MPWQQHVADVAFEVNADGTLVYSEVGLEVGRQEGKTALKFVVALHRLVVMVQSHGPQVVTYTMQDRKKARTRLERDYAVRLRDSRGFREIDPKSRIRPRRRNEWRLGMNSGTEHIQFGPSSFLQIDTPSRTGGHGDTLDLGLIDEAFAHQDDTVELSMEPALLVPPDSQLWVLSAAGDKRSKYLWRKTQAGRRLALDGIDFGAAWFEWSAEDDADPGDPGTWARCCPALGHTITEAKLAARWEAAVRKGQEGIDLFRRAYLCQWPEVPVLDDELAARWLVIPQDVWERCARPKSRIVGRRSFAYDIAPDRSSACIAVAGINRDGELHREVVEHRPGTNWVVGRLAELCERWEPDHVAADTVAAAGSLVPELEERHIVVTKANTTDAKVACGLFQDDCFANPPRTVHINQGPLNTAVAGADKRVLSGAWLWDRNTIADATPLVAVTLAGWAYGLPAKGEWAPLVAVT